MINPRGRRDVRNVTKLGNTNIVRRRSSDSETAKLITLHTRHIEKVVPSEGKKVEDSNEDS
jgi:hypothetical protein